jgi:hypothetical protein
MKKLITFSEELRNSIQGHANKNNDGNYTKSVIQLIGKGLKVDGEKENIQQARPL